MNMLFRLLKRVGKWAAIFFGGGILLYLAISLLISSVFAPALDNADRIQKEKAAKAQKEQQDFVDGWQRWADEVREKDGAQSKEPPEPGWEDGFQIGFSAGMLTARNGGQRPDARQLEAISRQGATQRGVPEAERNGWKRGFSTGWSYGWQKGK